MIVVIIVIIIIKSLSLNHYHWPYIYLSTVGYRIKMFIILSVFAKKQNE